MNILVTGGCGFIGSPLVCKLKDMGHHVIILDKKSTTPNDYSFDIGEYSNFEQLNDEDIDVIYHLAAQANGYISLVEPELDADSNAKGTLNVCNFARKKNVKKIIYTSSMAIYGEGDWLSEKDKPLPLSNYGVSKYCGEMYVRQFSQYGIDYTIFRLFNTYGPGQDLWNKRQGIVNVFLSQIIRGNRINVTGSLERYRDLTYIDDVVDALVLAIDKQQETSKKEVNVCSKVKITVKEIIDMLIKASGKSRKDVDVVNVGKHDGDQFGNTGDNTVLKTLGWQPKVKLEEGIKHFYDYALEKVMYL